MHASTARVKGARTADRLWTRRHKQMRTRCRRSTFSYTNVNQRSQSVETYTDTSHEPSRRRGWRWRSIWTTPNFGQHQRKTKKIYQNRKNVRKDVASFSKNGFCRLSLAFCVFCWLSTTLKGMQVFSAEVSNSFASLWGHRSRAEKARPFPFRRHKMQSRSAILFRSR